MKEVRDGMRLGHDSIPTERTCFDWIKRYVPLHRMENFTAVDSR
jgi:hypothetical protein